MHTFQNSVYFFSFRQGITNICTPLLASKMSSNKSNITSDKMAEYEELLFAPKIIVFLLIIFINLFILYIFHRKKTLIRIPSNRLILSLSVCHLLCGFVFLFQIIIYALPSFETSRPENFKYRILVDILMAFMVKAIVIHLCGITLDRFISIFYALRYKAIVTVKNLHIFIAFAWLISFFASFIQMTWLYEYVFFARIPENNYQIAKIETSYSICVFVIFLVIPLILLGIAFILMFLEIRKILHRPQPTTRKKKSTRNSYSKQRRVLYTFGLMYLFFNLITMPYFTLRFMYDLMNWIANIPDPPSLAVMCIELLKETIAFVNPILYITTNREFRLVILQLFSHSNKRFRYTINRLTANTTLRNFSKRTKMKTSSQGDSSFCDSGVYDSCFCEEETSYFYSNNNNDTRNNSLQPPIDHPTLRSFKKLGSDINIVKSCETVTVLDATV